MGEGRGKERHLKSRRESKKIAKKVRKESGYNIKGGPEPNDEGGIYRRRMAETDGVMRKMKYMMKE
jgi:hypothetical protein